MKAPFPIEQQEARGASHHYTPERKKFLGVRTTELLFMRKDEEVEDDDVPVITAGDLQKFFARDFGQIPITPRLVRMAESLSGMQLAPIIRLRATPEAETNEGKRFRAAVAYLRRAVPDRIATANAAVALAELQPAKSEFLELCRLSGVKVAQRLTELNAALANLDAAMTVPGKFSSGRNVRSEWWPTAAAVASVVDSILEDAGHVGPFFSFARSPALEIVCTLMRIIEGKPRTKAAIFEALNKSFGKPEHCLRTGERGT